MRSLENLLLCNKKSHVIINVLKVITIITKKCYIQEKKISRGIERIQGARKGFKEFNNIIDIRT